MTCPHKNTIPQYAEHAWGEPTVFGKCLDCGETLS